MEPIPQYKTITLMRIKFFSVTVLKTNCSNIMLKLYLCPFEGQYILFNNRLKRGAKLSSFFIFTFHVILTGVQESLKMTTRVSHTPSPALIRSIQHFSSCYPFSHLFLLFPAMKRIMSHRAHCWGRQINKIEHLCVNTGWDFSWQSLLFIAIFTSRPRSQL